MNQVERFRAVMNFEPVDRLPCWEWAMWWDETIRRWHAEGLPRELKFSQVFDIARHFALDPCQQFWFSTTDPTGERDLGGLFHETSVLGIKALDTERAA